MIQPNNKQHIYIWSVSFYESKPIKSQKTAEEELREELKPLWCSEFSEEFHFL